MGNVLSVPGREFSGAPPLLHLSFLPSLLSSRVFSVLGLSEELFPQGGRGRTSPRYLHLLNIQSRNMSSAAEPRSQLLPAGFNQEAAAVVTILLGLFQMLLSLPLAYTEPTLPKFFLLPLLLGILIMTGGSFTFANERNASRQLLRGCACSHLVGLLGTLLAFCLYCYTLNAFSNVNHCGTGPTVTENPFMHRPMHVPSICPKDWLAAYGWSVTLLLLLYDTGAAVMHSLLTVSALKALKTD